MDFREQSFANKIYNEYISWFAEDIPTMTVKQIDEDIARILKEWVDSRPERLKGRTTVPTTSP